jgi:phenylacetate-coenzyme A ligase PaaK-like adenylate-forming protein
MEIKNQIGKLEIKDRIRIINERLARYIPPRNAWTPAEEALFTPVDLFRMPVDEARVMQLRAIKHTFTRHYKLNQFYRSFCKTEGFAPEDIRTYDDLEKIPLIPDVAFKQHPSGEDFAYWITVIYTGELPKVVIKGADPTFDDVINAFNAAGMAVTYSTGTSGRFTIIPREQKTLLACGYAIAKTFVTMWRGYDPKTDGYLLFPNPKRTNSYVGKTSLAYFDMMNDVQVAIDRELTISTIQAAMKASQEPQSSEAARAQSQEQQKMIDRIVRWLEYHDETQKQISMIGAPYIFLAVMERLMEEGKNFDFGERGVVVTGGGWKIREDACVPIKDFRKQVRDVLGIPEHCCFDVYAMVEGSGWMMHCPEGHYLHAPYTYYKPFVLDKNLEPADYGELGRLAFLDALAGSYPGFVISGDEVRMHERCPVCDRPGPVLEPEVKRAKGEEVRGCANVVQSVFAQTLQGDNG